MLLQDLADLLEIDLIMNSCPYVADTKESAFVKFLNLMEIIFSSEINPQIKHSVNSVKMIGSKYERFTVSSVNDGSCCRSTRRYAYQGAAFLFNSSFENRLVNLLGFSLSENISFM